jgi:hypothetical protein
MARRRSVDPYPQLGSLERTFQREAVHLSGARRFYASEGVIVFAGGKDGMAAAAGAVWLRPSAYRRMNHYLDLKQSPSVGGFQAIRPPARGQQPAFAPDVFAEFKAAAAATKNLIIDGDRRVELRSCEDVDNGTWTWRGQVRYEHTLRLADGERIVGEAQVEIYARPSDDGVDLAVVITRTGDFEVARAWLDRAAAASKGWQLFPVAMDEDDLIGDLRRIETTLTGPRSSVLAWSNPHFDRVGPAEGLDEFLTNMRRARYETEMLPLNVVEQRMTHDSGAVTHLNAFVGEYPIDRQRGKRPEEIISLRIAQSSAEAHLFLHWHHGRTLPAERIREPFSRDLWDVLNPIDWDAVGKRDYLLRRWAGVLDALATGADVTEVGAAESA